MILLLILNYLIPVFKITAKYMVPSVRFLQLLRASEELTKKSQVVGKWTDYSPRSGKLVKYLCPPRKQSRGEKQTKKKNETTPKSPVSSPKPGGQEDKRLVGCACLHGCCCWGERQHSVGHCAAVQEGLGWARLCPSGLGFAQLGWAVPNQAP